MTKDEIKIWKYMLDNRLATAEEISKATKVSLKDIRRALKYIGTHQQGREKEISDRRMQLLKGANEMAGDCRAKD